MGPEVFSNFPPISTTEVQNRDDDFSMLSTQGIPGSRGVRGDIGGLGTPVSIFIIKVVNTIIFVMLLLHVD